MKIKIFTCSSNQYQKTDEYKKVENEINEFIADKKVIDIKQSESVEGDTPLRSLTLTVLYE